MARLLVAAPPTVAGNSAANQLLTRMRADGHEAISLDGEADLLATLRTTDAVIAVLDGPTDAAMGATLAYARTQHKPILGLHSEANPPAKMIRLMLADHHAGESIEDWLTALPGFYARVQPFAGRLVRDMIPQLVKDAGHDLKFRSLSDDEKPRFLKDKVLDEARQLRNAEAGAEKEEIADVLESLETLIRVRGYDRDALRQVKDAKRKRRGGFERGWVVEAMAATEPANEEPAFTV